MHNYLSSKNDTLYSLKTNWCKDDLIDYLIHPNTITLENSTFQPLVGWFESTKYGDLTGGSNYPRWNQYSDKTCPYHDFNDTKLMDSDELFDKAVNFIETYNCKSEEGKNMKRDIHMPDVKNVIFNAPATIVFWADGTKTVVKCMDEDTYSKDVGLAMCFMKKMFEADDRTYIKKDKDGEHEETAYGYKKVFKKWIDDYGKE